MLAIFNLPGNILDIKDLLNVSHRRESICFITRWATVGDIRSCLRLVRGFSCLENIISDSVAGIMNEDFGFAAD